MPCTSSRWARRVAPAMLLPTLVLALSACALPTWTPGGAASTTDVASPGVNIEPQTAGTAVVGLVTVSAGYRQAMIVSMVVDRPELGSPMMRMWALLPSGRMM